MPPENEKFKRERMLQYPISAIWVRPVYDRDQHRPPHWTAEHARGFLWNPLGEPIEKQLTINKALWSFKWQQWPPCDVFTHLNLESSQASTARTHFQHTWCTVEASRDSIPFSAAISKTFSFCPSTLFHQTWNTIEDSRHSATLHAVPHYVFEFF